MSSHPGASLPIPSLSARTIPLDDGDANESVLDRLSGSPSVFVRLGHGLVGTGVSAIAHFSGPHRFNTAATWWSEVVKRAQIDNPIGRPGSGLVAFGAFTFADESADSSVLVIPRHIYGSDEYGHWETTIMNPQPLGKAVEQAVGRAASSTGWLPGDVSPDTFRSAVSAATEGISCGELHKVVLARDIVQSVRTDPDWSSVMTGLAEKYPDTHVFCVDGFFGASPETLARVRGESVTVRVLAGSAARGAHPASDGANAAALMTSAKDLDEHRFAVKNVEDSLKALGVTTIAIDDPYALKLPNLWHLATDIAVTMPHTMSGLAIIGALHPTAAVAGTPTDAALNFINEHEQLDRGRYAGPVGWVDYRGDGDWAIGLRCARYQQGDQIVRAYAGAGIVSESDPERELLETELKLRPIVEAIGQ